MSCIVAGLPEIALHVMDRVKIEAKILAANGCSTMLVYSLRNMSAKNANLVSTADAARKLGYTLQHTRLLIRQGRLPALKLGRDWVIERRTLFDFATRRRKNYSVG